MSERASTLSHLVGQAAQTADGYLREAIKSVEYHLGEGAAEKFPQIVSAFMTAASRDYLAGVIASRVAPALEDISKVDVLDAARVLASAIEEAGSNIAGEL